MAVGGTWWDEPVFVLEVAPAHEVQLELPPARTGGLARHDDVDIRTLGHAHPVHPGELGAEVVQVAVAGSRSRGTRSAGRRSHLPVARKRVRPRTPRPPETRRRRPRRGLAARDGWCLFWRSSRSSEGCERAAARTLRSWSRTLRPTIDTPAHGTVESLGPDRRSLPPEPGSCHTLPIPQPRLQELAPCSSPPIPASASSYCWPDSS